MSLEGAAAALGLPEALVQRSAEARAAETGSSVDEILAAWAGGEAPPAAAEAPVEDEASAPEADQPEADETPTEEPAAPVVEVASPDESATQSAAAATTPTRAPVPAEVTAAEAAHLPEVVTVPTAGITERTNFSIPKWLVAVLLIVPAFALFALGGSATGACGEATELGTDVITGEIVNCDGSEFTGGAAGGGGTDFITLGGDIYNGVAVTGVNCAGCHGANGQGAGAFPAMTGVMTTFGACGDHVLWVTLATADWPDATYGDTNKPVGGGGNMPGFASSLSPEQIAAVSAYERVRFGGADADATLVDCGLAEPEGDEAGEGEEGEDGGSEEGGGEDTDSTMPSGDESEDAEASAAHSG